MVKIHDPIIQHMWPLPYQQSDNVIWLTGQSLQRWRTKANDVQNIQIMVQIKNQFLYLNMWKLWIDKTCGELCGTPNIHIYTN